MSSQRFVALACLAALAATLVGCGPAFRYRPADTLPKGHVEFGGGIGAGARMNDGTFGGGELQAWVRGGANDHVEIGARGFTHMFSSYGGALDLRFAPIKGPIDLSLDLSFLGGGCCLLRFEENRVLGASIGVDVGLSVGKRFGGQHAPAVYLAPHFQLSRTFPLEKDWPLQLFVPVGVDIPLGKTIMRVRPEVVVAGLFYQGQRSEWRVAGGVGLALSGPGIKLARQRRRAKKAADEEARQAALAEPPGDPPSPGATPE